MAITSITPVPYTGLLHNLETTEHVYLVGAGGELVHNQCNGHHSIPKFLGGFENQVLVVLDNSIHVEFHKLLHENLGKAGLPTIVGGKKGSTAEWAKYMLNNPGAQRKAFDAVLDTSRSIDKKYGTLIAQSFWSNIVDKAYKSFP